MTSPAQFWLLLMWNIIFHPFTLDIGIYTNIYNICHVYVPYIHIYVYDICICLFHSFTFSLYMSDTGKVIFSRYHIIVSFIFILSSSLCPLGKFNLFQFKVIIDIWDFVPGILLIVYWIIVYPLFHFSLLLFIIVVWDFL